MPYLTQVIVFCYCKCYKSHFNVMGWKVCLQWRCIMNGKDSICIYFYIPLNVLHSQEVIKYYKFDWSDFSTYGASTKKVLRKSGKKIKKPQVKKDNLIKLPRISRFQFSNKCMFVSSSEKSYLFMVNVKNDNEI